MEVGDSSEDHRRACEARWVLTLPFNDRRPYLDRVERHRRNEGRRELEAEIWKQHRMNGGQQMTMGKTKEIGK